MFEKTALQKDKSVQDLVDHFISIFGVNNFVIKDYWDADLCVIGFENLYQTHLLYVNSWERKPFHYYIELEELDNVSRRDTYAVVERIEVAPLSVVEDFMRRFIVTQ